MTYRIDSDRIEELLTAYEARRDDRRYHPEEMLRRNPEFRDDFDRVARQVVLPVLQDVADALRRRVDAVSIFHRVNTVGITVKLDPWEDFDRTLLLFGDEASCQVRITHEGVGFSFLRDRLPLDELVAECVEEAVMDFLERVLHREPAGEELAAEVASQPPVDGAPAPARTAAGRRARPRAAGGPAAAVAPQPAGESDSAAYPAQETTGSAG